MNVNKLKDKINNRVPGLTELLSPTTVIAGGFIRDCVLGIKPKDIDIFTSDLEAHVRIKIHCENQDIGCDSLDFRNYDKGDSTAQQYHNQVQIIQVPDVVKHILTFDFTINMLMFDGEFVHDFGVGLSDLFNRKLQVNNAKAEMADRRDYMLSKFHAADMVDLPF